MTYAQVPIQLPADMLRRLAYANRLRRRLHWSHHHWIAWLA